jgi:hypothetical protein
MERKAQVLQSYPHGLDFEFQRGVLIDYDEGMWVQLKARKRPHVIHAFFDTFLQGQSLVRAGYDDDYFASLGQVSAAGAMPLDESAYIQNRLNSDRQCHPGDLIQVIPEEP